MTRFLCFFILLFSSCIFHHSPQQFSGVTLGLHSQDYSYDYEPMISEIKNLGSEWICIHIKLYQENIYADSIYYKFESEKYLSQFRKSIRQSKVLGMKVFVMPILLLNDTRDGDHWRGLINPTDKPSWYKNYTDCIVDLASLLEQEKVELFSIGSEFNLLQADEASWENMIQEVNEVYSGALTYSGNWDALENIEFFDQLDYAGISSYFSLSYESDPSFDELLEGWTLSKNYVLEEVLKDSPPILITELGYASIDSINTNPWFYSMGTRIDLEEQKDCFDAFIETWQNEPRLAGVFFYEWFGLGGRTDRGYTFKDKPAEESIKKYLNQ